MSATRVVTDERRAFFTPKTLAAYLALSERTVRQMLADRQIPSYKVAGVRRIDPVDVDAYLAAHRDDRR
ncbi:MAG: helix-turn-helix domain-containing protein [Solirubrobacteraceae bacterium]